MQGLIEASVPHLAARFSLVTPAGLDALNGEINRQASMIAYIDDFKLMFVLAIVVLPLLLLTRPPRTAIKPAGAQSSD